MFLRLRLPSFVSCDDEQVDIDGSNSGQHVFDEPFVAGNVDDAYFPSGWQPQPGESQVNGEAPFFLLFEPVGIDAGKGSHQGALAVVNVPGRANYVQLTRWALSQDPPKSPGDHRVVGGLYGSKIQNDSVVFYSSNDRGVVVGQSPQDLLGGRLARGDLD